MNNNKNDPQDRLSDRVYAWLLARLRQVFVPWPALPFNFRTAPVNLAPFGGNGYTLTGVTIAAASTATYNHPTGFNRTPVGALLLDNGTTAQTGLVVTARSNTSITFGPASGSLTNATVIVF